MSPAAESLLPLLHSLPIQDRLEVAAYLKRGLISDPKMSVVDKRLVKQALALKPRQRRMLSDLLSMLNHPTDDPVEKMLQEILKRGNGLRYEVEWRLNETLPEREPPPLSKAQVAELKRRIREVDAGKARLIPWEKVKAKMDALSAKRKAKAEAEAAAARIDWSRKPRAGFVPADVVLQKVRHAFEKKTRPKRRQ
jgi:putative addiction module component (TIGR02574 family)